MIAQPRFVVAAAAPGASPLTPPPRPILTRDGMEVDGEAGKGVREAEREREEGVLDSVHVRRAEGALLRDVVHAVPVLPGVGCVHEPVAPAKA